MQQLFRIALFLLVSSSLQTIPAQSTTNIPDSYKEWLQSCGEDCFSANLILGVYVDDLKQQRENGLFSSYEAIVSSSHPESLH
jgi:hypothetical protein